MLLTVIGCSGSLSGADGPASCYLLEREEAGRTWRLVLDLGPGAVGALHRRSDPRALDAVLLSHLHPDHCSDLSGLHVYRQHHPDGRAPGRLAVHAPAGAAERIGRAHGTSGVADVTDEFAFVALADRRAVRVGPFTVLPVAVRHPVPAFGFRVSAGGRTLAYTGDTDSCPALSDLMTGAHVVLADASYQDEHDPEPGVHLSARRAAEAAVAAGGVGRLVLTHLPPWNDPEVSRGEAAQVWPGEVELAHPGLTVEV